MAEASDVQGILYQNLVDAGCDRETVRRCMALFQSGKTSELLRLLAGHRKTLLDAVHRNQKQIDCLDYLVYQTEKEQCQEESK